MSATYEPPRWLRDLQRFLPLKSQFVLSGNVRDLQVSELEPGTVGPQSFIQTVTGAFLRAGYAHIVLYDPIAGFQALAAPGGDKRPTETLLQTFGLTVSNGRAAAGSDLLSATLERLVAHQGEPVAMVIDFASRLLMRADQLSPAENQLFTRALVSSHQTRSRPAGPERQPFYNTVLWIVEKEGDLPDWFLVNNPRVRHIPVAKPDHVARRALARALIRALPGFKEAAEEARRTAIDAFVDSTEGLLLLDLNAIAVLARVEGLPLAKISDAVRRYKVGVTEDPWLQINHDKIRGAEQFIGQRVKGQPKAVVHMLDIVKRAMTGVGGNRRGNRPRGVAFLAGPTGVGKTELAKGPLHNNSITSSQV